MVYVRKVFLLVYFKVWRLSFPAGAVSHREGQDCQANSSLSKNCLPQVLVPVGKYRPESFKLQVRDNSPCVQEVCSRTLQGGTGGSRLHLMDVTLRVSLHLSLHGIWYYLWGTGSCERQNMIFHKHRLWCVKAVKDNTDQFHLFSQLPLGVLWILKGKRLKLICISNSLLKLQRRCSPPIFSVSQVGAGESK